MLDDLFRKDKCSFTTLNKVIQKHFEFDITIDIEESKYNAI
jgi:hypothetical protein